MTEETRDQEGDGQKGRPFLVNYKDPGDPENLSEYIIFYLIKLIQQIKL